MSKKIWNRIFKTKSTNKTPGISKKTSIQTPPTFSSAVENRLSYYEEFHNCCQQQPPIKEKTSHNPALVLQTSSNKSQSKFFKVVNTFTLKRNSKENQNNQLNSTTTSVDTSDQTGNNYAAEEPVSGAIMDKIGTPTTSILNQQDFTIEPNEEPISLELIPCPTCSRTFVQQTLEKHVRICEKMTVRKRKIFDSSRQRREGTELASYPLPKNYGLPAAKHERGISPKPIQVAPPVLSPKKPPEELNKPSTLTKSVTPLASKKLTSPLPTSINLLGTASGHSTTVPKERSRAAAVTKRIQPPPAEPCPYCERCFGVKAYDRHVEWCKEKALIASIKQNSTNSQVAAKGRLEARIKYRAPCLKTKRSVNRDKYSCQNDENFDMQTSMDESRSQKVSLMTSSMTSSFMSDGLKPPKKLIPLENTPHAPADKTQLANLEHSMKKKSQKVTTKNVRNSLRQSKLETLKSVSTDTIVTAATTLPMSDVDLEQLFEKEFQYKTSLERTKLHANTQASKNPKTSKAKSKRKSFEAPLVKAELEPKNSCGNRRRIIKERIELFSSESSLLPLQTESSIAAQQVPGRLPKNKSFIVSGVSDNYDPFISAERQLEELCSPSSPTEGMLSPSIQGSSNKTPTTSNVSSTSDKMTASFTSRTSLTNPRRVVTTPKSNFHRTSSLRAPRRAPLPMATRPIFFPLHQKQRPTIQRGLSDEGPISSNFLKPEEYDEMPVRAVCVNDFAISNTPRVIRRDSNAATNRKNLRLNLPGSGQSSKDCSPTPSTGAVNSNLLKTDSLAVFLKYENEAKGSQNSIVNTKDLKDKSNTLSKQNSAKSVNSTDDKISAKRLPDFSQITDNSNTSNANLKSIRLDPIVRPVIHTQSPSLSSRQCPPTVDSTDKNRPIKLNSIFDRSSDGDYIDPKLINVCDNLPMELGNDLASNSSSCPSYSGGDRNNCDTEKLDRAENENMGHLPCSSNTSSKPSISRKDSSTELQSISNSITKSCTNSNRSSGVDSRNQLKRKIRLGRNQFLYDASPEALDNYADDEDCNRSPCEPDRRKPLKQSPPFPTLTQTPETSTNIPPFSPTTFDEFDFEEFLSAFDNDDEQFPSLFKDCREFLMNRSALNKRSNINKMSSYRSANELFSNSSQKYEQDVEQNLNTDEDKNRGEIFISIETDQNENDPHPKNDPLVAANPSAQIEEVKLNDNKFQKIEDDAEGGSFQAGDEESDNQLRMRRINLLSDFPNVRINNAKNLIQQMHEDFQDLHANARADVEDDLNGNNVRQITESSLYPVDSDEISSIECYPVRRGGNGSTSGGGSGAVQSKHSADSAYGSLSRQSPSNDTNTSYRSHFPHRTKTNSELQESPGEGQSAFQYSTSTPHKYSNSNKIDVQKYRCRNLSAGSSSSSDNSLPPIIGNKNQSSTRQDNQSQINEFKRSFYRNPLSPSSLGNKSQPDKNTGSINNSGNTNNLDPPTTPTLPTIKASKFCHECGSKFLLDQAKFCMDCGVRRIVLK